MRVAQTVLMACMAIFTFSSFAVADEKTGKEGFEAYSLGDIYVKEGKIPVTQQTTITNIITAEDIQATNSRTVAEALSYVPGVRVFTGGKTSRMYRYTAFSIRPGTWF